MWKRPLTLVFLAAVVAPVVAGDITVQVHPDQFVAFQDGTGPWRTLTAAATPMQTVQVNDPAGRYSLFEGPLPGDFNGSTLTHSTLAEYKPVNKGACAKSATLEGKVTNIPTSGSVLVYAEGVSGELEEGSKFNIQVSSGVPLNVAVVHYPPSEGDQMVFKASAVVFERGVTVGVPLALDWSKAVSLLPQTAHITGVPAGMQLTESHAEFMSEDGGGFLTWHGAPEQNAFTFTTLPAHLLKEKDSYLLRAMANDESHQVTVTAKTRTTATLALPAAFDPALPKKVSQSPVLLSYSGLREGQFVSMVSPDGTEGATFSVFVSPGWLAGKSTYTMPDLSKVEGWKDSFGLPTGDLMVSQEMTTEKEGVETQSRKLDFIKQ